MFFSYFWLMIFVEIKPAKEINLFFARNFSEVLGLEFPQRARFDAQNFHLVSTEETKGGGRDPLEPLATGMCCT